MSLSQRRPSAPASRPYSAMVALIPDGQASDEAPSTRSNIGPFLVTMLTGAILINATFDMPNFGDPEAPIHQHVAPRYIQQSGDEIGVPNIVTSVLASYRGFDTLGEVVVVFTAACGVLALLGRRRRPGSLPKDKTDAEAGR